MKNQEVNKSNIPEKGTKVFIKNESYGYFIVSKVVLKSNGVPYKVEVEHRSFSYSDSIYRVRNFKPSNVFLA